MLKSSVCNIALYIAYWGGEDEELRKKNSHRTQSESSFNFSWKSHSEHELSWYLTCTYFYSFLFSVINPFYVFPLLRMTNSLPSHVHVAFFPLISYSLTEQVAFIEENDECLRMTQEHDKITQHSTLKISLSCLYFFPLYFFCFLFHSHCENGKFIIFIQEERERE